MRCRRVQVAHNPVAETDDASTRDVLDQVATVEEGLLGLGLPFATMPLGSPADVRPMLDGTVVFNLVESPPGLPRAQVEIAAALADAGCAFTGSAADALWLTTDKVATRQRLEASGLPVAPGVVLDAAHLEPVLAVPPPWILKPACEDASLGLDGPTLCRTLEEVIARESELRRRFPDQPVLVEHFLPGREFNVTLLQNGRGPRVLPIAEMRYLDFPPELPEVLGYEAKWCSDSFAYRHTVRTFPDRQDDRELLDHLTELAVAAWLACGVSGYARVDMRLDEAGRPCLLEVNANPCISGDSGYMASAQRAGLGPAEVVARILAAAEAA